MIEAFYLCTYKTVSFIVLSQKKEYFQTFRAPVNELIGGELISMNVFNSLSTLLDR